MLIDVQRGGPSTGLPTKTEQSDLLLAMYGRHGESPLPIVAAKSPSHCFDAAFEAVRIALKYRTPVILLTDGYLANGAEPWLLPDVDALPDISVPFAEEPEPRRRVLALPPRPRDARPSVGDPRHARASCTASVASRSRRAPATSTTSPANHELMTHIRADKVAGIAKDIPEIVVDGDADADVLVLGWGSTWGPISEAVRRVRAAARRPRTRTSCTSTRSPRTSARCCARTARCWCPR